MTEHRLAIGALLFSLLLYFVRCRLRRKQSHTQFWQRFEQQWREGPADFFYFAGLPYLAIIFGLTTTRHLGLKGLDHFALIRFSDLTLFEIQRVTTLILFEWLLDGSLILLPGGLALLTLTGILFGLRGNGITITIDDSTGKITYDALHWAFYRALLWLISSDLYLGVVLSAGLVTLEWLFGAYLQQQRLRPNSAMLMRMIVLISTSVIFFYSPNLWLLWLIHVAMIRLINSFKIAPSTRHSTLQPR